MAPMSGVAPIAAAGADSETRPSFSLARKHIVQQAARGLKRRLRQVGVHAPSIVALGVMKAMSAEDTDQSPIAGRGDMGELSSRARSQRVDRL